MITTFPEDEPDDSRDEIPKIPGYEIQDLLGRGGMGAVYRAWDTTLGRTVAIKLIAAWANEKMQQRFREETRAVAKLQHPNIAQIFESGTANGQSYFVQEFVGGGTLSKKLAGKPQDPRAAAVLMETIARAVGYYHSQGILHRDLKPENVLLTPDGIPKITDFGLAKGYTLDSQTGTLPDGPVGHNPGLTRTGEIVGTPAYMAPEQASGVVSNLGPAVDIHALGAILYEALTGRPPFQAADVIQTLMLVIAMDPVSPRTLQPRLSRDLETICLKCLEKHPRNRYATATDLAEDLARFLHGEPIRARRMNPVTRAVKWARRRRTMAALLGLSVVVVLAIVAAAVWLGYNNARLVKLNDDLTKATRESDRSFGLTQSALDRVVSQIGLQLEGIPQTETIKIQVYEETVKLYRQLIGIRPDDSDAVYGYCQSMVQLASLYHSYGQRDNAAQTLATLTEVLERDTGPYADQLRFQALVIRTTQIRINQSAGHVDPATLEELQARYIRLIDDYLLRDDVSLDSLTFRFTRHQTASQVAGNRNQYLDRRDACRKAVDAARQLRTEHPEESNGYVLLSLALGELAAVEQLRRDYPAADAVLTEHSGVLTEALKTSRRPFEISNLEHLLASNLHARGKVQVRLRDPARAMTLFQDSETQFRRLIERFPLYPYSRTELADVLADRAKLLEVSDLPKAKTLVDEAIRLCRGVLEKQPNDEMTTYYLELFEKQRQQLGK
jgi:tetratricopeptide (TPR) repeat protein